MSFTANPENALLSLNMGRLLPWRAPRPYRLAASVAGRAAAKHGPEHASTHSGSDL
jgi:hypothetical protein